MGAGPVHITFDLPLPAGIAGPGGTIPLRILVHRAVSVGVDDGGTWIEGEREEAEVEGGEFMCVLFPAGTREAGRSGRRTEVPILLMNGFDVTGEPLLLHAENRLRMTSWPGLSDRDAGEYQVDGEPLPLGKPGRVPKGFQVNLRRIAGDGLT